MSLDPDARPWERQGWQREPSHPWDATFKAFDWPENGDKRVTAEELYQAFKERLMAELVAVKERSLGNCFTERNEFDLAERQPRGHR